jgi:sortase A
VKSAAHFALRAAERGLLWAALGLFSLYGFAKAHAWFFELRETQRLSELSSAASSSGVANLTAVPGDIEARPSAFPSQARRAALPGRAFGRIELPRLSVSALVAEGTDAATLNVAVGHLPGSAFPGEAGNVALAGHRDTFFRGLADARPGDLVRLDTPDGSFSYLVERLFVVSPDRVDVLASEGDATLTLVTCYPFSYIGRAPSRFIVRARMIPADGLAPAPSLSTKEGVSNGLLRVRPAPNPVAGLSS